MQDRNINIKAKYTTGTLLLSKNYFNILIVDNFVYCEDEKAIVAYYIFDTWDDGKVSKSLITEDEIESWLEDGLIGEISRPGES